MKCTIPEISWHNRDPVLSVDIQPKLESDKNEFYRLATGGTDSHVLIWYMKINETGSINLDLVTDLSRHQKAVNCVKWSPSGELLASSDDESVIFIWKQKSDSETLNICDTANEHDKETWVTLKILRGHLDDVYDLSWSPSSTLLLSGSVDNTAVVWDVNKGKSLYSIADHKGFVQGVAWDPLNQYIATLSTDRSTRLFKVNSTHCIKRSATNRTDEIHVNENNTNMQRNKLTTKISHLRFDFSPDGKYIIQPSSLLNSPQSSISYLYGIESSSEILKPLLATPDIRQPTFVARFCPLIFKKNHWMMKRMVFAISTETSVYIYDSNYKKPVYKYQDIHKSCITDMSWSNDGCILAISSQDGYCSFLFFSERDFDDLHKGIWIARNRTDQEYYDITQRSLSLISGKKDKWIVLDQHVNHLDQTVPQRNETIENIDETYETDVNFNPIFLEQFILHKKTFAKKKLQIANEEDKKECILQPKKCKKYIFEKEYRNIYLKEKYAELYTNSNKSKDMFNFLNPTKNQNFIVLVQHSNIPDQTVPQDKRTNDNIDETCIADEIDGDKINLESVEFDETNLSTNSYQLDTIKNVTETCQRQSMDTNSDEDYKNIPSTSRHTVHYLREQAKKNKKYSPKSASTSTHTRDYLGEETQQNKKCFNRQSVEQYVEQVQKNIHDDNNILDKYNIEEQFILEQIHEEIYLQERNKDIISNSLNPNSICDQTVPKLEIPNENINETCITDVERRLSLDSQSSNMVNLSRSSSIGTVDCRTFNTDEDSRNSSSSYQHSEDDLAPISGRINIKSDNDQKRLQEYVSNQQIILKRELRKLKEKDEQENHLLRTYNDEENTNFNEIEENVFSLDLTRRKNEKVKILNQHDSIPGAQEKNINKNETIPDKIYTDKISLESDNWYRSNPNDRLAKMESVTQHYQYDKTQSAERNAGEDYRSIPSTSRESEDDFRQQCQNKEKEHLAEKYQYYVTLSGDQNFDEAYRNISCISGQSLSQDSLREQLQANIMYSDQSFVQPIVAQEHVAANEELQMLNKEHKDQESNNNQDYIETENVAEKCQFYASQTIDRNPDVYIFSQADHYLIQPCQKIKAIRFSESYDSFMPQSIHANFDKHSGNMANTSKQSEDYLRQQSEINKTYEETLLQYIAQQKISTKEEDLQMLSQEEILEPNNHQICAQQEILEEILSEEKCIMNKEQTSLKVDQESNNYEEYIIRDPNQVYNSHFMEGQQLHENKTYSYQEFLLEFGHPFKSVISKKLFRLLEERDEASKNYQEHIRTENLAGMNHFNGPQFPNKNYHEDYTNIPSISEQSQESLRQPHQTNIMHSEQKCVEQVVPQDQLIAIEELNMLNKESCEIFNNNQEYVGTQIVDKMFDEDYKNITSTTSPQTLIQHLLKTITYSELQFIENYVAQEQKTINKEILKEGEDSQESNNNKEYIRAENGTEKCHSYAQQFTDRNCIEDYRNIPSTSRQEFQPNKTEVYAEKFQSYVPHGMDIDFDKDYRNIPSTSTQSFSNDFLTMQPQKNENYSELEFLKQFVAQEQIIMNEGPQMLKEEEYQEQNNNQDYMRTQNVAIISDSYAPGSTERNSVADYRNIPSTSRQSEDYLKQQCQKNKTKMFAGKSQYYVPQDMDIDFDEDYRNVPSTSTQSFPPDYLTIQPQKNENYSEQHFLEQLVAQEKIIMKEEAQILKQEKNQESNNNQEYIRKESVAIKGNSNAPQSNKTNIFPEKYQSYPPPQAINLNFDDDLRNIISNSKQSISQDYLQQKQKKDNYCDQEFIEKFIALLKKKDPESKNNCEYIRTENVSEDNHCYVPDSTDRNSDVEIKDVFEASRHARCYLRRQLHIKKTFCDQPEIHLETNRQFQNSVEKLPSEEIFSERRIDSNSIGIETIQNRPTDSTCKPVNPNIHNSSPINTFSNNGMLQSSISQVIIDSPDESEHSDNNQESSTDDSVSNKLNKDINSTEHIKRRKLHTENDSFDVNQNSGETKSHDVELFDVSSYSNELFDESSYSSELFDESSYSSDSPTTNDKEHRNPKEVKSRDHIRHNPIRFGNNGECTDKSSQKFTISNNVDIGFASTVQLPLSPPTSPSTPSPPIMPSSNSNKKCLKSRCKPDQDYYDNDTTESDSDYDTNYKHGSVGEKTTSSSSKKCGPPVKFRKLE